MLRKLLTILILAATCAPGIMADDRIGPIPVPPRQSPATDDEERPYYLLVGEAENAAAKGNWQEAADRLVDAMSVEPDNPSNVLLMSNLGMMYSALDRDTLSLQAYTRALEMAPKMTTVYNLRARQYLKMHRDAEACADFEQTISIDSLNLEARYYHGLMALYGGRLAPAEADFAVLRDKHPKAIETAIALSTLYTMTGRDTEAIPYLVRICEVDPAPEFFASLAGCYLTDNNLTEAAATIADGMERYPLDPDLYYYRAWLNRERKRLDDARADAKRAIELGADPRRVGALFDKKDSKSTKK